VYIHVRVTAGAKKEDCKQKSADHFVIAVREKAERNQANTRVCEIIAKELQVSVAQVRIVNGHHSPSKLLSVTL